MYDEENVFDLLTWDIRVSDHHHLHTSIGRSQIGFDFSTFRHVHKSRILEKVVKKKIGHINKK